jgi:hypothetical protein
MERCLCSACGERQPATIPGANVRIMRSGVFSEITLLNS